MHRSDYLIRGTVECSSILAFGRLRSGLPALSMVLLPRVRALNPAEVLRQTYALLEALSSAYRNTPCACFSNFRGQTYPVPSLHMRVRNGRNLDHH
jgi:hypothetical protein